MKDVQSQKPPCSDDTNRTEIIENQHNISHIEECFLRLDKLNHHWHFLLTLVTFGLWGLIWWRIILRSQGKQGQFFHGFDDAYWSHLIEREQPPAALHTLEFDKPKPSYRFEA